MLVLRGFSSRNLPATCLLVPLSLPRCHFVLVILFPPFSLIFSSLSLFSLRFPHPLSSLFSLSQSPFFSYSLLPGGFHPPPVVLVTSSCCTQVVALSNVFTPPLAIPPLSLPLPPLSLLPPSLCHSLHYFYSLLPFATSSIIFTPSLPFAFRTRSLSLLPSSYSLTLTLFLYLVATSSNPLRPF